MWCDGREGANHGRVPVIQLQIVTWQNKRKGNEMKTIYQIKIFIIIIIELNVDERNETVLRNNAKADEW